MTQTKLATSLLFNISKSIGGLLVFITSLIIIYEFVHKDRIELRIMPVSETQLTKELNIEGLKAEYLYKDSVVKNLWSVQYIIGNYGSKTIYSQGNRKNIMPDHLSVIFKDSVKILSVKVDTTNSSISAIHKNDSIYFDFKQWKSSEYIIFTAIVENFGETKPSIYMEERGIYDAEVTFLENKPQDINEYKSIIEYFPNNAARTILKIEAIIFIILLNIIMVKIATKDYREKIKTNSVTRKDKIGVIFDVISAIVLASFSLLWIL